jgi:hypothetical protein
LIKKKILKQYLNLFKKIEIDLGLRNKNMHAMKCNPINLFENFLLLFK